MRKPVEFTPLLAFLARVPAIRPIMPDLGPASNDDGAWLIKFQIDIAHPAAWATVMDLGYVVNWLSVHDRLPTVFKPVSVPPDMNGDAPADLLWWLIECWTPEFSPADLAAALEGNLCRYPGPVSASEAEPGTAADTGRM
ncbi:MAG: hypothetical protein U0835_16495 [Isosphaeraceae bacterium]